MSVPLIVLFALTLSALAALAIASARMSSQLREMQAQWLKDVSAQRDLQNHNTKQLEAKLSESSEQSLSEERSLKQRVDKLGDKISDSISSLSSELSGTKAELHALPISGLLASITKISAELSETKNEIRSLPLFDYKARAEELQKRADAMKAEHGAALSALEKEHRSALGAMEKTLHAAREIAETRARELAQSKGELGRVEAEIKAHEGSIKSSSLSLETLRNALRDSDARAARFEKQMLEITAAARLDKQLVERLGLAEERLNALTDALRKAESEVWTERTAKESMGLEVRAVRDDMKRLTLKLNEETQRREALEKWAAEANAKLAYAAVGNDASSAVQGPESKALASLAPALAVGAEITAPVPRSIRPVRQSQAALAAAAKKNQPEEPAKIASWWCSICGKGGTNMATACKHEWKRNERGELG